ncbi:cobalt ECF transporter T component CbiQ [Geothermobacter hydrogeniphilus]|uniref:Cobalt ECF transporter T component CbiQ n=1 Tax=Geothermobacter hydrogeniphilus TaxID=1969733 RepID=A0A1X0YAC4_9BACT|nr:cobalt ECF transporter T component CbiQ [Geothermobacter hydrogeniphilus]ORJ62033.1 cobalt ECF transporter T component CbiQ [Geothermobacter hydrogeniphilus]
MTPQPIILPGWSLAGGLLLLLLMGGASSWGIRRLVRGARQRRKGEPDWSLPQLDDATAGDSPIHRWEVRCKLVGMLGFAFLVVSLQDLRTAAAAGAIALSLLFVTRLPFDRSLARLLAMSGFLGMFLLVMPFSAPAHPGDILLQFGNLEPLPWNLRGLHKAATICLKACAVALLMEPLLATAPLTRTLQGLRRLGVPATIGQMLLLAHRYSYVFKHEAWRMATGMRLRGFQPGSNRRALGAYGNFLGMLFVRSFERTERVYDAMQARGYRDRFPEPEPQPATTKDLLLAGFFLLLGVALLLADRCYFSTF